MGRDISKITSQIFKAETEVKLPMTLVVASMLVFAIINSIVLYLVSLAAGSFQEVTAMKAIVISGYLGFVTTLIYGLMIYMRHTHRVATAYGVGVITAVLMILGATYLMSNYYNLVYSSAFVYLLFLLFVSGLITYIIVVVVMIGYMGWFNLSSRISGGLGGTGYK